MRVFIGQFIKAGEYGEVHALARLSDRITCRQYGRGNWIRGEPGEEDRRAAKDGLKELARIVAEGRHDVVILDEANLAAHLGLFGVEELLDLAEVKPENVELVFTGRRADARLIERADLVTEMREVKHYFHRGVPARKGIES